MEIAKARWRWRDGLREIIVSAAVWFNPKFRKFRRKPYKAKSLSEFITRQAFYFL
ncbi:MAG: hypothetical protein LBG58_15480 [Planctomycetaceae bacterium]|nr:hypothetical protein [Planctomycetaceae bacterium]